MSSIQLARQQPLLQPRVSQVGGFSRKQTVRHLLTTLEPVVLRQESSIQNAQDVFVLSTMVGLLGDKGVFAHQGTGTQCGVRPGADLIDRQVVSVFPSLPRSLYLHLYNNILYHRYRLWQ